LIYHPQEVAENIKIPTLIIHGDQDEYCPIDESVQISQIIKSSELKKLPNMKHHYKERIGEVIQAIDTWLRERKLV
jgi:pimeloyl-ACP methyl ester carboxylesterase